MKVTKIGTIWCKAGKPFCSECIGPICNSCYYEEEEAFNTTKIIGDEEE